MALTATVTPGKIFTSTDELVTNSKLNQCAAPTVAITGSADTDDITNNSVTSVKGSYGPWFYCTDGGQANAHSLTAAASGTTLPTALVAGQEFAYTANTTNTGAVTVAISGIGATVALTKNGSTALAAGDVRAGQLVWVRYDGTRMQLATPNGQPRLDRYATTAGTSTAYTATFSPTLTALANGTRVLVKWNATNTSTATFAPDGLTAKAITKAGDAALVAGDIVANQISELVYDSTLDHWLLTSPVTASTRTTVPVRQTVLSGYCATTGLPGFLSGVGTTAISFANTTATTPVCIAFAAGHDSSGAVDYAAYIGTNAAAWTGLSTNGTYYLYAARDTSTGAITYGQTTTQPTYTFSGTASTPSGAHTYLINEGQMRLGNGTTAEVVQRVFIGECVVASSVVSTLTIYMPRGQYKSSADTAFTLSDSGFNEPHYLGLTPAHVRAVFVCQSTQADYAVGDEVDSPLSGGYNAGADRFSEFSANSTTLRFRYAFATYVPGLLSSAGASVAMTAASWKVRLYAGRGW